MTPEPLKNKAYHNSLIDGRLFWEKDVESAVEWLKEQVNKTLRTNAKECISDLIDKAFEDVVE